MYDDILLEQAALWDMVKEAAPFGEAHKGLTGRPEKLSDLSNYERMQLARGRYADASGNKLKNRSDTDFSRMDRLRAMAGRATGFYDIGSGRKILKAGRTEREGMSEVARKAFDKVKTKEFRKTLKGNEMTNVRRALIGGKGALTTAQLKDLLGTSHAGLTGTSGASEDVLKKYLDEMRRSTGRGLVGRGAGKAALVAGGLGAAGYGLSKLSSYDPVVEYVEDLDGIEFALAAEGRAAEILLANGIDPETFDDCYPEHVKIASFPDVGDADTYEGDELLEEYNALLDDAALEILEAIGF